MPRACLVDVHNALLREGQVEVARMQELVQD